MLCFGGTLMGLAGCGHGVSVSQESYILDGCLRLHDHADV